MAETLYFFRRSLNYQEKQQTFLLILSSFLFFGAMPSYSDSSLPKEVTQSVALLTSRSGICGTGFFTTAGDLVTTAHLARSLCPYGLCDGVTVRISSEVGAYANEEVETHGLSLVAEIPSLDIAALRPKEPSLKQGTFSLKEGSSVSNSIVTLGFPRCQKLAVSRGKITTQDELRIFTTTRGSYGSSGSPVFSESFKLIGMVDEATSIWGALLANALQRSFDNRAIPVTVITEALTTPAEEFLRTEAALLLKFYRERIQSDRSGLGRLLNSLDFLARVRGFQDRLLLSDLPLHEAREIFISQGGIGLIPRVKDPRSAAPLHTDILNLALAHQFELYGLRTARFEPIDVDLFLASINRKDNTDVSEVKKMLLALAGQPFPGIYLSFFALILWGVLLFIPVTLLWSWSLGQVFAATSGTFLRKTWRMIVVGTLFWPISWIIFLVANYKKRIA